MPSLQVFDLEYLINLDDEDLLYNQVSEQFNEITTGFYAKANLELLNRLHIREDSRVLDLACGTGHLAIEIAKRAPLGEVTGVDLSSQMITKGLEDAKRQDVSNIEFIERNIHEILPEFKLGDFDIGISCFALSYLGCDFLLKEFYGILGDKGQIGITTSSTNSLIEWQPLLMELMMEFADQLMSLNIQVLPDMPSDAENLKSRLEEVGFKNVCVEAQTIPLIFDNSHEAASYLISAGWLSNGFFKIKDKNLRRTMLQFLLKKVEALHQDDPHISTSIEFLIGWNAVR